jgi:hypothetical protein
MISLTSKWHTQCIEAQSRVPKSARFALSVMRRKDTTVPEHTMLWVLRDDHGVMTDCEAWTDGDVAHVLLRPHGHRDVLADFASSSDAVRWALAYERSLIAKGWEKVI